MLSRPEPDQKNAAQREIEVIEQSFPALLEMYHLLVGEGGDSWDNFIT